MEFEETNIIRKKENFRPRTQELWEEALILAINYASGKIEDPNERLEKIGEILGGCIHDIKDIEALVRKANRVKGNHE